MEIPLTVSALTEGHSSMAPICRCQDSVRGPDKQHCFMGSSLLQANSSPGTVLKASLHKFRCYTLYICCLGVVQRLLSRRSGQPIQSTPCSMPSQISWMCLCQCCETGPSSQRLFWRRSTCSLRLTSGSSQTACSRRSRCMLRQLTPLRPGTHCPLCPSAQR